MSAVETLLPRHFPGGVLRRMQLSDLAAFQTYRAAPGLGRYQNWTPMPEAEAIAFLKQMSTAPLFTPGEWMQLGIAKPAGNRLIGDIGIWLASDGGTAEIGFTLAPEAQGRGLATTAVKTALQLLFAATKVQQILGITDARNTPSIRLLERVGFRFKERRNVIFRGEPCMENVYRRDRSDT